MKKSALLASAALIALSAGAVSANTIGAVSALNQDVDGTPPAAETRQLVLGDGVVLNEKIESSPVGSGQFLFLDQTSLTIAKQSVLVLDKYIYDPATKTGQFAMSMSRGVLRFVGGRITKETDAVITTPTATIGIRGGMAIVIVDEDGTTRVMHIAGDYTRVTTDGGDELIISRSNGVADVSAGGGITYLGVADAELVKETSVALIGRGEAGEKVEPQDPDVIESGLPDANSARKGASEENPISTRGEASPDSNSADRDPNRFQPSEEEITSIIVSEGLQFGNIPPGVNPLVLLPGVTGAASFSNSGIPGLVNANGQSFVFTQVFQGSRVGITSDQQVFSIPVKTGSFNFNATQGASPRGGISGSGFHDPNAEFTFAVFQNNAGQTGAFLTGTPSATLPNAAAGRTTIRTYNVSNDLRTKSGAPFVPSSVTGFSADGRSNLTLLSNSGGAATDGNARAVMTYLDINGNGAAQTSGFGVLTADVVASDNGTPAFEDFFEGSFRGNSGGATRIESTVATTEDGVGNSAFGPNAKYFALTNDRDLSGPATASRAITATGVETEFGSSNFAQRTSTKSTVTGTTSILSGGYAAIGGQDLTSGALYVARNSSSPDGFVGQIDPQLNQASATIRLDDIFSGSLGGLGIGEGSEDLGNAVVSDVSGSEFFRANFVFGGENGRSAAIDRDQFAMRDSELDISSANGVNGLPNDGVRDGQGSLRGSLATADLAGNAANIFPAGITPTSSVLTWGWWSAEFRHDPAEIGNSSSEGSELSSDQRMHLGAWVAGDLTGSANLPQFGSATYEGFAVVSAVQNGATFVDGAGYTMDYDFGSGLGTASFTGILGANAEVAVSRATFGADFNGSAGITIGGDNGIINVDGSFFNGRTGGSAEAAAGSLSFATNNGNTFGTGIFAGDRTSVDFGQ